DCLLRQRDADLEQARRNFSNAFDATDNLAANKIIAYCRNRHFNALLDREGSRALLDRTRIALHVIDRLHAGSARPRRYPHQRSLTGAAPSTSMMRARVAAVVSSGSASGAKKPCATIS